MAFSFPHLMLVRVIMAVGLAMASPLAAAIGLTSFFIREKRFEAPLVRLHFFRSVPFFVAIFTLAVTSFVQSPITLFTPIYMQDVLAVSPLKVGLVMMAPPISTLIAGPIGGRLADRNNPRVIASIGILLTLVAVFLYAQLGVSTAVVWIVPPLILVGFGAGLYRPANQVAVYATVDRSDFGSLSAMITSLGTLGATVMIAISEMRATSDTALAFAEAQQFAFTALLPLLMLAAIVSFLGRSAGGKRETETAGSAVS